MAQVARLQIKKSKGQAEEVSEIQFKEGFGIIGDRFAKGDDRQVSLFEIEPILEGINPDGFCITNFSHNISVQGLNFSDLKVGTKLYIGDAIIQLTVVGKKCYSACPAFNRDGNCDLFQKAAYAKVIKSGKVKVGHEISEYFE